MLFGARSFRLDGGFRASQGGPARSAPTSVSQAHARMPLEDCCRPRHDIPRPWVTSTTPLWRHDDVLPARNARVSRSRLPKPRPVRTIATFDGAPVGAP